MRSYKKKINQDFKVLFYDAVHYKNIRTAVSPGSKSQLVQYLASKNRK